MFEQGVEIGQDWIPPKYRAWVYRVLGAVLGLNTIFGWFSDGVTAKIVAVAGTLGFSLAAIHTPTKDA
jgi:hypothetical protein